MPIDTRLLPTAETLERILLIASKYRCNDSLLSHNYLGNENKRYFYADNCEISSYIASPYINTYRIHEKLAECPKLRTNFSNPHYSYPIYAKKAQKDPSKDDIPAVTIPHLLSSLSGRSRKRVGIILNITT